tara:strand:+ start:574 stop:810 length:237 start_codon:yes stop_codon:yes gene_type:complete
MSVNNQAQDRYNAPLNRSVDFEQVYFRDLEVDDLFWLRNDTANGNVNHCHRKINPSDSMNLITRQIVQVGNIKVYQKD